MVDEIPLTRDQLYEQVWTEPMTKVAARLGLSDVGLAKTLLKTRYFALY